MAVMSIVKLSELEGASRIDAEYYQPEYINLVSLLKKSKKVMPLKSLTKEIVSGSYIDTYFEKGTLYLRVNNLTENGFDFNDIKFVDVEYSKIPQKIRVNENDLIVGRTGTIGITHIVPKELNGAVMSQHITKIVPRFAQDKFYLMAYLNTKFARLQAQRVSLGSMQVELTLEGTRNLLIFLPDNSIKEKISKLILQFYEFNKQSETLYSQAESLLLSELGLQDFKPKDKLCYQVNLSDLSTVHRIDAEYFNPSYEEVIDKIKSYKNGYEKLLNLVENIKPKFEPHKFPQKTFSYIELADINASIGVIQSSTNIIGEEAPSRAKRILKRNDVIVSSVEGSLEKVALVDEQFEGSLASTGFFQLRPKNIIPEVLLVLAKSPVIQIQLKKECAGTILTAVPKEAVKNLIIPILPIQTQQKIAKLVQQSHEARRKAKQLLKEAKRKVENAIEKQRLTSH